MSAKKSVLTTLSMAGLLGASLAQAQVQAQAVVANAAAPIGAGLEGWLTLGASVLAVMLLAWRLRRSSR